MTDKINDGGLAFPFQCQGPNTGPEFYYGMTLRDYFAAKAMQGYLTHEQAANCCSVGLVAQWSYEMADAMLCARELA